MVKHVSTFVHAKLKKEILARLPSGKQARFTNTFSDKITNKTISPRAEGK